MIRLLILSIFLLAILVRFLYFPGDLYFAFDQARDAFKSQEIMQGDFKILGPPSAASDKIFAGPLVYYIFAPIYFLSDENPEAVSAFLRIWNAIGVFLVFGIGLALFNKWVGLISSFFFGISYEASQYSLFLSHQPMAVISNLIFYFGLSLFFFKKNQWGLVLGFLGWGLSMQFHYVYLFLLISLIIFLIIFKKYYQFKIKYFFWGIAVFILTISTFILAEFKFQFRFLGTFLEREGFKFYPQAGVYSIVRFLHDSILANYSFIWIIGLLMISVLTYFFIKKLIKQQIMFLTIWFIVGTMPYFLSGTNSYYYSAVNNIPLMIFAAYIIYILWQKKLLIGVLILVLISFNNLFLIFQNNQKGVNSEFIIQPGMLLISEKQVVDYIYQKANKKNFAINGLTIPLQVNTTWDYLFEWYGKKQYGYLPEWGQETAAGFPGNLKVETKRSNLPNKRFTIIEPTVGIPQKFIDDFFKEENYFSKIVEEKKFGHLTVQYRERI